MAAAAITPLVSEHLPGVLAVWSAQRARLPADEAWRRPPAERLPLVAARLRGALAERDGRTRAWVALRNGAVSAYLIGREVRLPRGSTYLTYVPAHFLSVGTDDWGAATPADLPALADLYAASGDWAVARGAATHLLAIEPGDIASELWADLAFARHDTYAFLPRGAARAGAGDVAVRRAVVGDLDAAAELLIAEARHHHAAPIFAYAPPGLAEARRRDLAESLGDTGARLLVAAIGRALAGAILAYHIADPPSWAATALRTPCLYIDSAYVRPELRGRGVLRALVAGLKQSAPDGTAGLFVTYLPANLGAARAWAGLGFRPFAAIHQRRLDPRAARQQRGSPSR